MHREELLNLLRQYKPENLTEEAFVAKAKIFVRNNENCFYSKLLPGHITGSAWVVDSHMERVLLLHHKKQNQWFQPGGHADCDSDIRRVAIRETSEETGVPVENIKLISDEIFDVDMHVIPKSKYGVKFSFSTSSILI